MPPESEFTEHYRNHYQPGPEEPLDVAGCDLASSADGDTLSPDNFKSGLGSLNENRQPGYDDCAPEYITRGGPNLLNWLFILMTRVWTFACDMPTIDRIGRLIPIPKKVNATSWIQLALYAY